MIVCHCNRIDHRDIEDACQRLESSSGPRLLTPAIVYKELGKRPRCGGCLTLATNLIHDRHSLMYPAVYICPLAAAGNRLSASVTEDDTGYLDAAE